MITQQQKIYLCTDLYALFALNLFTSFLLHFFIRKGSVGRESLRKLVRSDPGFKSPKDA